VYDQVVLAPCNIRISSDYCRLMEVNERRNSQPGGEKVKLKYLCLTITFILLLSCTTSPDNKQAKIYVSGLESLIDKDSEEVVSQITDTWDFKCTKIWRTEDPAIKDVIDVVKDKTKFTKQEANNIFSSKGKYKVMFFFKYLRDESVRLGTISSGGYSTASCSFSSISVMSQ